MRRRISGGSLSRSIGQYIRGGCFGCIGILAVAVAAAMPASVHAVDVIGPKPMPSARKCTLPLHGSLVTGYRTAAYLKKCGQVAPGLPTTLVVADIGERKVQQKTYQIGAHNPHLVSTDDRVLRWVQMVPGRNALSDHLVFVELESATGRVATLDELHVPFVGHVVGLARGEGCAIARMRGGPATGGAALVLVTSSRLQLLATGNREDVVFWDSASSAFVLERGSASSARAVDCSGRPATLSARATALLAKREHGLDRYLSIPATGAVAFDPLERSRGAAVLVQLQVAGAESAEAALEFPSIHDVAGTASGRSAVVTERSVEVFAPGGTRRSIPLAGVSGWYTQIQFLKGRPALVVLSGSSLTSYELAP